MTANSSDMQSIVEADENQALYVQTASSMSYDNGKLTLHSLAPTTDSNRWKSANLRLQLSRVINSLNTLQV